VKTLEERCFLMCAGNVTKLWWYSDILTYELIETDYESEIGAPEPLSQVPAEYPSYHGNPLFLSADDPWFVAMQKVRPQLPSFSGSMALAVIRCLLRFCSYRCVLSSALLSSRLQASENWQRRMHR
jgi:hypothetical protein